VFAVLFCVPPNDRYWSTRAIRVEDSTSAYLGLGGPERRINELLKRLARS
jgi:hypothetical protein